MSSMEYSKRGQLPSETARAILRDVWARGLKPGDALGDEAWCIEHYAVSRGTLREALRLLSFLGAISVKSGPGGGPRVTTPASAVVGSALGAVVQFSGATLLTVFQARTALEPPVAAAAALNRSDQDIECLDRQIELLKSTQSTAGHAYATESSRFHLLVAEASHNQVLSTIVPALSAMTATVPWRYIRGSRPEITDRAAHVVAAIKDRDNSMAAKVMADLFSWIMDDLLREQPDRMATPILWPDVDEVLAGQRYR